MAESRESIASAGDESAHAAKVAAARLSVCSNAALTVLKLTAGLLSGSVGVLSEAAHSGTDLVASLVAFFSVRVSDLPADEEHPYGHGKVESLSGILEALLIVAAAALILYEAIGRLVRRTGPHDTALGIAVMAFSAVANTLVSRHLYSVAREYDSIALRADAQHLRTDVLSSLGVLAGLVAVRVTRLAFLDAAVAILVAVLILYGAWQVTRGAVRPLLDAQLPADEIHAVRAVLDSEPHVMGYHKLRTRKSGASRYVDAHVQMQDDMTLLQAHDLTEALEDRIRDALPNVEITLHTEPYHAERRHQLERHGGRRPDEVDKRET